MTPPLPHHLLPDLTAFEWLAYIVAAVLFLASAWIHIGRWDREHERQERRRRRMR